MLVLSYLSEVVKNVFVKTLEVVVCEVNGEESWALPEHIFGQVLNVVTRHVEVVQPNLKVYKLLLLLLL